jgi:hypothetical protein
MKKVKQKLTLDQPAIYQIKVPGHLDESWSDWAGGIVDQAALQGLLRRLYSLGLPLISAICVACD